MTPGWLAGVHATESADGSAGSPRDGTRRVLPVAAGLVTALGLAWYFTGPPWYLGRTSTPISHQEEVLLIGLQAVAKGHLPYVGVASVQYGPGTQVLAYWLMRHVTSFSVVGFREAWALLVWAGVSVLFAVFFLAFGYARGLVVSVLSALVYPALHEVAFQPGGTFDGYFGWASPLRYAGVVALVLLLPAVIMRCPAWRGTAAAAAIGALWGLTSYLAQENLAGGAVGALTAGGLLLFSGTASRRAVLTALAAVLAGFLVIWLPVLAWYGFHGQLAEFLRQYFLFPKAVASGANDTPWGGFRHTNSAGERTGLGLRWSSDGSHLGFAWNAREIRAIPLTAPDGSLPTDSTSLLAIGPTYTGVGAAFICHAWQGWSLVDGGSGVLCAGSLDNSGFSRPVGAKPLKGSVGFVLEKHLPDGSSVSGMIAAAPVKTTKAGPDDGAYLGWANADGTVVIGSTIAQGRTRFGIFRHDQFSPLPALPGAGALVPVGVLYGADVW